MKTFSTRTKKQLALILAATALTSHSVGAAESGHDESGPLSSGYYAQIRGSANFLDHATNGANSPIALGGNSTFDTGFGAGGAIGRELSSILTGSFANFRVEAEVAYNENGIERMAGNPEVTATTYMANLLYDFPIADTDGRLVTYVGAGLGGASLEADGIALSDDEDTVFAYQVRAGLGYRIRPGFHVSLGYRFFDADDPEFRSSLGRFETEYRSHAIEAGFRYTF